MWSWTVDCHNGILTDRWWLQYQYTLFCHWKNCNQYITGFTRVLQTRHICACSLKLNCVLYMSSVSFSSTHAFNQKSPTNSCIVCMVHDSSWACTQQSLAAFWPGDLFIPDLYLVREQSDCWLYRKSNIQLMLVESFVDWIANWLIDANWVYYGILGNPITNQPQKCHHHSGQPITFCFFSHYSNSLISRAASSCSRCWILWIYCTLGSGHSNWQSNSRYLSQFATYTSVIQHHPQK